MIKIGDTIICIRGGGNNTSINGCKNPILKGFGPFIVKAIHSGGKFEAITFNSNTLETECGNFLWNNSKYFKVIKNKEPHYEIY